MDPPTHPKRVIRKFNNKKPTYNPKWASMGVENYRDIYPIKSRDRVEIIGSYGFLLPHKGIVELIEAFATLKMDFKYLKLSLVNSLYPIDESHNYL